MKCSESWLREWVNPNLTREELANTLTMAGLEVEELKPVAKTFTGVVIGKVIAISPHPEADRLKVCGVQADTENNLQIVCGASNVKIGMKVAVAQVNALLSNQVRIEPTVIRGVASQGMLCSASELGLAEESDGLIEFAVDAPIGEDVWHYLHLGDYTIDISVTPNRGDCLSVRGIARELSALTNAPLANPLVKLVVSEETGDEQSLLMNAIASYRNTISEETIPVTVNEKAGCPRYLGRVISKVKADVATPAWLKERLRRSGVRSITPIVDVTNYVMLELGQPMHAFDLKTIDQGIVVRQSIAGEKLILLDGNEKELNDETLIIADQNKPLAIAGVMGGLDSSVTLLTTDIFLESAYFSPQVIAKQRQYYGLNSDSAYRFERGIDPTMQREAIERATQLIIELVGGEAGPIIEVVDKKHLPQESNITLLHEKIAQILGVTIPMNEIKDIFNALQFTYDFDQGNWKMIAPPYRHDIKLPEDVIEEIARLYGYDKIPTHSLRTEWRPQEEDMQSDNDWHDLRLALSNQGYNEIITYSFIDKKMQQLLDPNTLARELINPITNDMAVMRTNMWPGLINTMLYNKSRQQQRIRLFEIGCCFIEQNGHLEQKQRLAGLISGTPFKEQWGIPARKVDFFDLKGNLENLLISSSLLIENVKIEAGKHPALHPGQTAKILYHNENIGIFGALHPKVLQALDLTDNVFVFELDLTHMQQPHKLRVQEVSKFPEIRRDIAILVDEAIPAQQIQDTIKDVAGDWLKNVFIFDVYQGKGISVGLKSIALGLVIQHPTRTLVDDEVTELMDRIILALKGQLKAELRS